MPQANHYYVNGVGFYHFDNAHCFAQMRAAATNKTVRIMAQDDPQEKPYEVEVIVPAIQRADH